jgi:hypothetical protein
LTVEAEKKERFRFYHGGLVSWLNLKLGHDLRRRYIVQTNKEVKETKKEVNDESKKEVDTPSKKNLISSNDLTKFCVSKLTMKTAQPLHLFQLFYFPGAGASTLARRILYLLATEHNINCLVLREIPSNKDTLQDTIKHLMVVYSSCVSFFLAHAHYRVVFL